jgi:cellulose synthase/poly-beta-1,6-N-acetylglucosamine synthase-like glycosyltransferase
VCVIFVCVAALGLLYLAPQIVLTAILSFVTLVYITAGAQKFVNLILGMRAPQQVLSGTLPDPLPMYSVLVPLRRERAILPTLLERLRHLDYPEDRLEVLLLVEQTDQETQQALAPMSLPAHFDVVVVPAGLPRTKPRALNVGLAKALGEFIVVYDAEDCPERDQLKKAVAEFSRLPSSVVCLQARLGVYNAGQSWLTKLFALDYAIWFHALLPGLDLVPLGGTSNHFRARALRRLGGWDPYNVTEDADLGVRIARAGFEVRLLDSATWEEAVPTAHAWLRQRSRWVKGYVQTYLVHMRHPRRLVRELGWRRLLTFQGAVGASMLTLLVNPLMWALTLVYFVTKGTPTAIFIESLFPGPIYYAALSCLVIGNFLYMYLLLYSSIRFGLDRLAPYSLLGPVYWALMSVGAWVGLVSLVRRPYYWAKTEHGVSLSVIGSTLSGGSTRMITATQLVTASDPPPTPVRSETDDARAGMTIPAYAREISVILPAHNEEAIIADTVRSVADVLSAWQMDVEIVVVDDGSTDGTRAIVDSLAKRDERIRLISHSVNRGYGAALATGFEAAAKSRVFFMDSDGQFDIRDLRRLLPLVDRYDAVLGYRVARQDTWMRKLNAFGWKQLVWLALGIRVRDIDCAFKLLPRAFFRAHRLQSSGAMINAELLYKLRRDGYSMTEVGVRHFERQGGRATGAKLSVIVRALRELAVSVWTWRIWPVGAGQGD